MDAYLTRRNMSLTVAQKLTGAAVKRARSIDVQISVAVVDASGIPVAFARMDGALVVSALLATDKAWTAVACGTPTETWTNITQPGGDEWGFNTALGGRIVVQAGGIPVLVDGDIVGGVGVSGGTLQEDKECAEAAIHALGPPRAARAR